MKSYGCLDISDGINTLGIGQINAALFFAARFTTLEPYYMWIDLWTAIMFTLRAIFFLRM